MHTTTFWCSVTEGASKSGPAGATLPPGDVDSNSGGMVVEVGGWLRSSACECVFSRYRKDGRALQQSEKVGQTSTSVNHSRKEKRDM